MGSNPMQREYYQQNKTCILAKKIGYYLQNKDLIRERRKFYHVDLEKKRVSLK